MSTQGRAPKSGFDRQQPPRAQSNSGMASPARHGPVLAFGGAKPSGGAPLPSSLRAELEARFGAELGSVRVHADGVGARSAHAVGAKAVTVAEHIAFAEGRFAPGTAAGRRLLGHELAHVIQQRRGGATSPTLDGSGVLESGAVQAGDAVAAGRAPIEVAGASAVGLAADPEVPWYERAVQGVSSAASAVKGAYDDPRAALAKAESQAKEAYNKLEGKAQTIAAEAKAAWDKSDVKKYALEGIEAKSVDERISSWVETKLPTADDKSARANLVRSANGMLKAAAKLRSEPTRAAARTLLNGHPIQAVKDWQKATDDGLKEMKAATWSTINDWEDGKFEAREKTYIDPAAHPTLAQIEGGANAASKELGKRQRQLTGGAAKAVYTMVEGIENIFVHPVNTVEGLSKVADMASPLPSADTLKEGAGFARDIVDPKVSTSDAFKRLYEAENAKQEARQKQSLELLKGLGHNYVEAAGGEFVPPEAEQKPEQKARFAGRKPGEIIWSDWSERERTRTAAGRCRQLLHWRRGSQRGIEGGEGCRSRRQGRRCRKGC